LATKQNDYILPANDRNSAFNAAHQRLKFINKRSFLEVRHQEDWVGDFAGMGKLLAPLHPALTLRELLNYASFY
jgi:hypothetical protein